LPTLDPSREQAELTAYLGDRFELDRLHRYEEQLEAEFAAIGDEAAFYRGSESYLYNLTAFAMTGTKLPYLERLAAHLPGHGRVLDYGCGIGSDGLMLLEAGYRVEFADFANPSTDYLRWRIAHRGLEAPVHDLDTGVPEGFDAAYAFDVIEHVPDPFAFLLELERRAAIVAVNFLAPEPRDQTLHRELPIRGLLAAVAAKRLRHYELLYGRSHLVVYEPERVSAGRRLANLAHVSAARLAAGRR
jgi:SAM-dependent methyltransferase